MKFILIGGTGFIGSAIAKHIEGLKGSQCVVIGSEECDLSDYNATLDVVGSHTRRSVVVFAAGIPRHKMNNLETMKSNITMVSNVIEACNRAKTKKVIYLSSVEVYGVPEELPITEDSEINPNRLYAIGKVAAEYMWKKWAYENNRSLAILRLPGVYGVGCGGMLGHLFECIRKNKTFRLINGGRELRDFLYVDDIAKVVRELSRIEFAVVNLNVATGQSTMVADIVEQVFSIFGNRCRIEEGKSNGRLCHLTFDISRLRNLLPALAMTPLNDGLILCKSQIANCEV